MKGNELVALQERADVEEPVGALLVQSGQIVIQVTDPEYELTCFRNEQALGAVVRVDECRRYLVVFELVVGVVFPLAEGERLTGSDLQGDDDLVTVLVTLVGVLTVCGLLCHYLGGVRVECRQWNFHEDSLVGS